MIMVRKSNPSSLVMPQLQPFHLAMPIRDIEETRAFYTQILGCIVGREAEKWIDFNFFGHQVSFHVKPEALAAQATNTVDGKNVPVTHFGVILQWDVWHALSAKLSDYGIDFIVEPYIRFSGKVGEQATMFFLDPSGNALEFKSFKDPTQIFQA